MTTFGDLGNNTSNSKVLPVVPMKFSPQKSPFVSIGPQKCGNLTEIWCKVIPKQTTELFALGSTNNRVVCFGITLQLHHILVKFSEKNYGDFWGQMVNYVNDFTPSPHDF